MGLKIVDKGAPLKYWNMMNTSEWMLDDQMEVLVICFTEEEL